MSTSTYNGKAAATLNNQFAYKHCDQKASGMGTYRQIPDN